MPSRLLVPQRPSLIKPTGPMRLDWSHPTAKGLISYFLLGEGAGVTALDLAVRGRTSTLAAGASWVTTLYGVAVKPSSVAAQKNTFSSNPTTSGASWTAEIMFQHTASDPAFAALLTDLTTWGIYSHINHLDLDGAADPDDVNVLAIGGFYHAIVRWDGANVSYIVNGVDEGGGANTGISNPAIFTGWGGDGVNPAQNNTIIWLRIWDRYLATAEAMRLAHAPHEMLVSQVERLRTWAILGAFISGGSTPVTVSDALTGSETVTLASMSLAVADALAGGDSPAILVQIPISDTLAGGQSLSLGTVSLSVGDALAGGDSTAVTVSPFSVSDAVTGAESVALATLSLPISDALTGAESLNVQVTQAISDSASGGDSVSLAPITISVSDALTGAELQSITATLSVSDALTGGDSVSNNAFAVNVSDSLTGAETVAIGPVSIPISDNLAGGDSFALALPVALALNDNGVLGETPTLAPIPLTIGDALSGSQSVTLIVTPAVVDTLAGSEAVSVQVGGVSVLDNASGSEALSFSISGVAATDAATGQDTIILTITQQVSDVLAGGEAISVSVVLGIGLHGGPIVRTAIERFSVTASSQRPSVASTSNFRPSIGGTARS